MLAPLVRRTKGGVGIRGRGLWPLRKLGGTPPPRRWRRRPRGQKGCWAAGGGVEGATGESDPSSDAPGGWRRWVRNQCRRDRRPTQRLRAVRDAWAVARQSSELDGLLFQARPAVSPGQVGDAREARLRGDGLGAGANQLRAGCAAGEATRVLGPHRGPVQCCIRRTPPRAAWPPSRCGTCLLRVFVSWFVRACVLSWVEILT